MDYKDLLVMGLLLLVVYHNSNRLYKVYKHLKNKLLPVHHYQVTSDISLIQKEQRVLQDYMERKMDHFKDKNVRDMLLYSLGDGKRVRPVIVMSIYRELTKTKKVPHHVMDMALAIEYIHCASLVIDDIMDDDDERRGKPAVHTKYGLIRAHLVTIILCTSAMQNIFHSLQELNHRYSDTNKSIPFLVGNLVSNMLHELGVGQYCDLFMSQTTSEAVNTLKDVIHKKTSSLFEFCFILPWILANYNKTDRDLETGVNQMKTLARQFGLLFQISDDFEDVEKDSTRDDNSSSINYVIRKGYEEAYKDYTTIDKQFKDLSRKENVFTPEIKQLVTYLKDKATIYYRQRPN